MREERENINARADETAEVVESACVTEFAANSVERDFKSSASAVGLRGLNVNNDGGFLAPADAGPGPNVSRNVSNSPVGIIRNCAHCGKPFTLKRLKTGATNKNTHCSKRCAAHAPRPNAPFHTPDSTKAERVRANGLINKRLKLGHIARPSKCVRCGKTCKPDSHHPDYQEPDLIAWVCRSCHMLCHNRPEIEREVASLARRARKAVTR